MASNNSSKDGNEGENSTIDDTTKRMNKTGINVKVNSYIAEIPINYLTPITYDQALGCHSLSKFDVIINEQLDILVQIYIEHQIKIANFCISFNMCAVAIVLITLKFMLDRKIVIFIIGELWIACHITMAVLTMVLYPPITDIDGFKKYFSRIILILNIILILGYVNYYGFTKYYISTISREMKKNSWNLVYIVRWVFYLVCLICSVVSLFLNFCLDISINKLCYKNVTSTEKQKTEPKENNSEKNPKNSQEK